MHQAAGKSRIKIPKPYVKASLSIKRIVGSLKIRILRLIVKRQHMGKRVVGRSKIMITRPCVQKTHQTGHPSRLYPASKNA